MVLPVDFWCPGGQMKVGCPYLVATRCPVMDIGECYAISGTDISSYATPCPVLPYPTVQSAYALSSTDFCCGATHALRAVRY
eukprot:648123-Rhodomonas_salina.5